MSSFLQEAIKIMINVMEIANILRPKADFSFLFTFVVSHFPSIWGLYFLKYLWMYISSSIYDPQLLFFSWTELSSLHCQKPDLIVFNQWITILLLIKFSKQWTVVTSWLLCFSMIPLIWYLKFCLRKYWSYFPFHSSNLEYQISKKI